MPRLREDVVVSVCFTDISATDSNFQALRDLAHKLDQIYRFREIILVVRDSDHETFLTLVEQVPDLRLFIVRPGTEYYDRRVIAAEESIGDIIVIANYDELSNVDVTRFIEQAEQTNSLVLATGASRKPVRRSLTSPMVALGHFSGFRVNLGDLQTIAMPRTILNQLLLHSDPQLALRFPPRDARLPLSLLEIDGDIPTRSLISDLPRRIQLLQKLLVYLAPSLLMLVSLSATFLALLGMGFAIYVVAVWLFAEDLAPGWLTTSGMLSLSAMFMGLSILGLSLGMQQLLNRDPRIKDDRVSEEVNRVDLFGKVASDLNIEIEEGAPSSQTGLK